MRKRPKLALAIALGSGLIASAVPRNTTAAEPARDIMMFTTVDPNYHTAVGFSAKVTSIDECFETAKRAAEEPNTDNETPPNLITNYRDSATSCVENGKTIARQICIIEYRDKPPVCIRSPK